MDPRIEKIQGAVGFVRNLLKGRMPVAGIVLGSGLGKLVIHSGIGFAFIEDIDGHDGRKVIRISGQHLEGTSHIGAVRRAIGANLGKRFFVDLDDFDVAGRNTGSLVKVILDPAVGGLEDGGRDKKEH